LANIDFNLNLRVGGEKRFDHARQQMTGEQLTGREAHHASELRFLSEHQAFDRKRLGLHCACGGRREFALRRRRVAAARAFEQLDAESFLHGIQAPEYRGMLDAHGARCAAQRSAARDRQHAAQLVPGKRACAFLQ
jgi:hypothetical protein